MRRLASKTLQSVHQILHIARKIKKDIRVGGVHGDLVLGRIADETLGVGEGNIRGRRAVTLVVGDNLNAVVLPDTDATVAPSK